MYNLVPGNWHLATAKVLLTLFICCKLFKDLPCHVEKGGS